MPQRRFQCLQLVLLHVLVEHITIELSTHILMASDLSPELCLSPSMILAPQKCAIDFTSLADVNNEGAGYVGHIDPLAGLIEHLKTSDMGR
jgi:hypothetical protein